MNLFTDIKVVLDLVPNHTSNESVWFEEALNGNEKYYNYFVWEDGVIDEDGNRHPPNNWVRVLARTMKRGKISVYFSVDLMIVMRKVY